jgi:hypothetical protein
VFEIKKECQVTGHDVGEYMLSSEYVTCRRSRGRRGMVRAQLLMTVHDVGSAIIGFHPIKTRRDG